MNVQNERRRNERRQSDPDTEAELSPEYLALLEVCGGEIRASDKAVLAERRQAADAVIEGKQDAAALPAADRRRARTA
jgi:hypothetical protein